MDKKIVVLDIDGEIFLLSTRNLTRADKIALESICSAAKDDYADEIEELSVYEKCGWLQDKIKSETGIVLENVGIELELMMRL